jgi:hypothetical protein
LRLALEYDVPDQVDSLTRQLHKVAVEKGEDALVAEVKVVEAKLIRDKAESEKKSKKDEPHYDENVSSGRTPTKVIDQIKSIDVTTPEGRAEWDKQRRDIAKKVGVPIP